MSRCLICDDAPEVTNDALLAHLRDQHTAVSLTSSEQAKRTARARVVALAMGLVVVGIVGVAVAAYLGLLVRIFDLIA